MINNEVNNDADEIQIGCVAVLCERQSELNVLNLDLELNKKL